jgi:hypothetical protein
MQSTFLLPPTPTNRIRFLTLNSNRNFETPPFFHNEILATKDYYFRQSFSLPLFCFLITFFLSIDINPAQ